MCKVGHKTAMPVESVESFSKTLKMSDPDVCETQWKVESAFESAMVTLPYYIFHTTLYNLIIFSDLTAALLRGC